MKYIYSSVDPNDNSSKGSQMKSWNNEIYERFMKFWNNADANQDTSWDEPVAEIIKKTEFCGHCTTGL